MQRLKELSDVKLVEEFNNLDIAELHDLLTTGEKALVDRIVKLLNEQKDV